ncbi:MAG: serine hydroxymethyltransferase [Eubacteriaceae bacterium]|jgi:glycine hydroxymethyltransferase
MLKSTRVNDPEVYNIVAAELKRQEGNIEMIASESTAPTEVLELSGSIFTNKTEEGYPGKRFQAGSEEADKIETLACERACKLFGAEHANVQSYSGSTANYTVYSSILVPGDRVLSMRLDQGGHLTHGSPVNFLRKVYEYDFYGVDPETEQIDYDALEKKAMEYKPKLIIGGASSYPREIDYKRMAEIAEKCGAYLMIDMAHVAGLVAAGVIPSPIPYADFVSSSTTKTFCGPRSGMVFCKEKYAKMLDKGTFPGTLGSIHLATIAAKAWSFGYAATPEFKAIMEQIIKNAKCLAAELQNYGFRIISGGTDNHIVMVDLRPKNLTGKQFEQALEYVGITVNKNVIPFDKESPMVTSGVRIGLTSTTQRGLKEKEIKEIAGIMNEVAANVDNTAKLDELKQQAAALIAPFPLYPEGYFED